MIKNMGICLIVFLIWQIAIPGASHAQDKKGKLGSFEDANKGEKSDDDDDSDYDFDDAGCDCFFSIFEVIISEMAESSASREEDEYVDSFTEDEELEYSDSSYTDYDWSSAEVEYKNEHDENESGTGDPKFIWENYSFGLYPYHSSGFVYVSPVGKSFAGQLSVKYQYLDDRTYGYRLGGEIQVYRRHGVVFDVTDYRESLEAGTDHLQIFNVAYRYMVYADDSFLVSPGIGLKIFQPDNFNDADFGLNFGVGVTWFFLQPFSLEGEFGFAPIIDEIDQDSDPTLIELELGFGIHFQRFELTGSYRTLIPSYDADSALYGPEFGIRVWF